MKRPNNITNSDALQLLKKLYDNREAELYAQPAGMAAMGNPRLTAQQYEEVAALAKMAKEIATCKLFAEDTKDRRIEPFVWKVLEAALRVEKEARAQAAKPALKLPAPSPWPTVGKLLNPWA